MLINTSLCHCGYGLKTSRRVERTGQFDLVCPNMHLTESSFPASYIRYSENEIIRKLNGQDYIVKECPKCKTGGLIFNKRLSQGFSGDQPKVHTCINPNCEYHELVKGFYPVFEKTKLIELNQLNLPTLSTIPTAIDYIVFDGYKTCPACKEGDMMPHQDKFRLQLNQCCNKCGFLTFEPSTSVDLILDESFFLSDN